MDGKREGNAVASTAVTREITYNVVSGAPIIEEVGAITVYKGVGTNVFVEIQNKPTQIIANTLLLGLKSDIESILSEDSDEDPIEGVRFTGMTPSDAELTVDDDEINIFTLNDGGEDSYNVPIHISSGTPPAMSSVNATVGDGEATFTWSAVFGAKRYAYRIGTEGKWIDVGNVVSYTVEDLGNSQDYDFYWRVNSDWIGNAGNVVSVTPSAVSYIGFVSVAEPIASVEPRGMTYDSVNHEVLIAYENGYWYRYEIDGTYIGRVQLNSSNGAASGITFASVNEILVGDVTDDKWYRYSGSGSLLGSEDLISGNGAPADLGYDSMRGHVLVIDPLSDDWYKYFLGGNFVGSHSSLPPDSTAASDFGITYDLVNDVIIIVHRGHGGGMDIKFFEPNGSFIERYMIYPPDGNVWGATIDSVNRELLCTNESGNRGWHRFSIGVTE